MVIQYVLFVSNLTIGVIYEPTGRHNTYILVNEVIKTPDDDKTDTYSIILVYYEINVNKCKKSWLLMSVMSFDWKLSGSWNSKPTKYMYANVLSISLTSGAHVYGNNNPMVNQPFKRLLIVLLKTRLLIISICIEGLIKCISRRCSSSVLTIKSKNFSSHFKS